MHVTAHLDVDPVAVEATDTVTVLLYLRAASLLITPTNDVAQIGILNDPPCHALSGGIMVALGEFYSGECRELLVELAIPAKAGLVLARGDYREARSSLELARGALAAMPVAGSGAGADQGHPDGQA